MIDVNEENGIVCIIVGEVYLIILRYEIDC